MKGKKVMLMAAVAAMSLQSCDFFKGGTGAGDVDSLEFCTIMYEDTAIVMDNYITQAMKIDFPVPEAEGVLVDSVRAYLAEAVAGHYVAAWGDDESTGKMDVEYSVGEEQAFVNAYAAKGLKDMTQEVKSLAEDGWGVGYSNDYTASLAVQTEKYVTYEESYDIYTGGAHGAFFSTGVTFRSSDGCQMGWNLFDMNKKAEIVALIRAELLKYFAFGEGSGVVSEAELEEQLQVWDDPDTPENELEFGLPLPAANPYIVRDGIAFVYQQYEVACYAAGLPSGVIPFDKLRDVLSDEGRELLGF